MADKGEASNKLGRNMQGRQGKLKKRGQQSHKDDTEKWPVDEIEQDR